jgi:hypothetical protein
MNVFRIPGPFHEVAHQPVYLLASPVAYAAYVELVEAGLGLLAEAIVKELLAGGTATAEAARVGEFSEVEAGGAHRLSGRDFFAEGSLVAAPGALEGSFALVG